MSDDVVTKLKDHMVEVLGSIDGLSPAAQLTVAVEALLQASDLSDESMSTAVAAALAGVHENVPVVIAVAAENEVKVFANDDEFGQAVAAALGNEVIAATKRAKSG